MWYYLTELTRLRDPNRTFDPMEACFACGSMVLFFSPFAYFRNEFIKIPHERVKNGHLGSISPHMVTKIAEMFYTSRNRVRQSGENTPNFVSFSASSGVEFPFSAQKNKRTVSFYLFSQKFCTMCKIFVKKDGFFRPAGGDMSFQVRNRVTPVI
jgi:hypothetical protein